MLAVASLLPLALSLSPAPNAPALRPATAPARAPAPQALLPKAIIPFFFIPTYVQIGYAVEQTWFDGKGPFTRIIKSDAVQKSGAQMKTVNFAAGESVFRQGDPATSVYLVTAGEWEVGTETTEGASSNATTAPASGDAAAAGSSGGGSSRELRVVARLGPGDHFGETALLEERNRRNTTVRCTSPACELREMPNEQFSKFLRESEQLRSSVHAAAVNRNNRRVHRRAQLLRLA